MPPTRSVGAVLLASAFAATQAIPAPGLADLPRARWGRAVLFSSRDPSGGNLDHGHFLATMHDGSRVLAACEGAGCITRVWSANPIGTLIVELDGEEVFRGPSADFFTNLRPGFGPPLSGAGPGGGYLAQVPMPFVHSMQMRAEGEGLETLYYQVGVERRVGLSSEVIAAELHSLIDPSAPHADARIASLDFDQTAAGTPLELSGPGEVVELRVHFQGASPSLDEARRSWIEVQLDDEPRASIQVPLGDLFGLAWDDGSLETLPLHGVDGDRELRLPMPFARELSLRSITVADDAPRFTITCAWRPLTAVGDRLPLRAGFMRARNQAGRPFAPRVLDGGCGHLVGFLLALAGDSGQGLSFLEGDLTLRIDGEDPPSIRGTGTEDDLDGAWYFRGGPFRGLFHSVATLDELRGRVVAARFLIPDPVPFTHSLEFSLEHGGGNDTPGSDYAATLFWYGGAPPARIDAPTRAAWLREQCAPAPIEWQLDSTAPQRDLARLRDRPAVLSPLRADGTRLRAPTIVEQLGEADIARASEGATRLRIAPWLSSLRAFRIAGPFVPSQPREGVYEVFAPERSGTGFDAWRALRTPVGWDGYVDLYREASPCDGVVMYAACEFDVDQDAGGTLVLGSDDAIAVFLDQRRIHGHVGVRGSGRDQDRVPLNLSQGHHRLVIKVENYDGGFGFHARFEGIAVREFVAPPSDSRK